jgi:uncharacterized protein
MDAPHKALLALQEIDDQIARAEAVVAEFMPRFEELEAPVSALEAEVETARSRLTDLRQQARRLESAANQKRSQLQSYEQRLQRVRTVREESAAKAELDLVRRAVEADEREALEVMEQATRTDLKLDELEKQLQRERSTLEPRLAELRAERAQSEEQLQLLRQRRQNQAVRIEPAHLRLYERVRSGRSRRVLAPLSGEACGNCFNVLPVQEQSQISRGESLQRCEACGVILYADS